MMHCAMAPPMSPRPMKPTLIVRAPTVPSDGRHLIRRVGLVPGSPLATRDDARVDVRRERPPRPDGRLLLRDGGERGVAAGARDVLPGGPLRGVGRHPGSFTFL